MSMAIEINNCQNGNTYFNLLTREIKFNYRVWQITSFTPFFKDREENVYVQNIIQVRFVPLHI